MSLSDQKKQWIMDLELIFQQAMVSGQLAIALKAKEILGKWAGFGEKEVPASSFKPLSQWSVEEIESLLKQIESQE
jgi:hypothetical protein